MNALELMAKARRALASAYKLLQDNDGDGACICCVLGAAACWRNIADAAFHGASRWLDDQ